MIETPFYYDWTFWSAIASIMAIMLSQLPPVKHWFRSPRVEIEVNERIAVTHKVGNPNIGMFVSIHNVGGRKLKLKSLSITLKRGNLQRHLHAPNYFETTSSQIPVLFIPRELKPGDSWEHSANFVLENERSMEQAYRKAESLLRTDINKKRALLPPDHPVDVPAEPELVDTLIRMFNERFIWTPGEYTIGLHINTLPASASQSKNYRFTLFESDSDELNSYVDDYKFGGGIYYHLNTHSGLFIPIHQSDDN